MKQIVIKQGVSTTVDVAANALQGGMIRVKVVRSCISPGTEMMGIASSGKSLLKRAMEQPDKAKAAIKKMASQGISSVLGKAKAKFGAEQATGYSAAGIVVEVADDVEDFSLGDRVAIAGAQYANHMEEAVVPINLVVSMPEGLDFDAASTVALGGIAMQGVRRAEATLGEYVAVIGCGVLGLLSVQMLRASGCRVVAIDLDDKRLALAKEMGAELALNPKSEDVVAKTTHYCNGQGADRVIITAATSSNEPLSQAFGISRRKGRVVLVGVVGPEFKRDDMYEKELDFVISTSYGPGRYDEQYERFGQDYPYGYVRWTEQRNMAAYLELLAKDFISVKTLINGTFPVEKADEAYSALSGDDKPLLLLFSYGHDDEKSPAPSAQPAPLTTQQPDNPSSKWVFPADGILKVGIIGAGAFVQGMHIPNLKKLESMFKVVGVCDQTGLAARKAAAAVGDGCREYTEPDELLSSNDVDMVLIGTRHNAHAELALKTIRADKGVFVEKPLCLTMDELHSLEDALEKNPVPFVVGHNRRFAPLVQQIKSAVANRINPLMIHYTMNAGYLPQDHWTQTFEGGGRIIGEGCHILDLFQYLVGASACSVSVDRITPATGSILASDNVCATIRYEDGSVCTLLYTALGNAGQSKERMEVFCDGTSMVLDDYQKLHGYGTKSCKLKVQDKGHLNEWREFYSSVKNGQSFVIPWKDLKETFALSYIIDRN